MGQTNQRGDPTRRREPVAPQPLGGSVRRAEDYATPWPGRLDESGPRRAASTGTWPAQPTRRGPELDRHLPSPSHEVPVSRGSDHEDASTNDGAGARRSPRPRAVPASSRSRLPRRARMALFEEPMASGFALVVVISAAAMWGVMRSFIDTVDAPLTLRLRADGSPGTTDGPGAIWQVPFVATMLGLMSIGTALFVARRDQFAARFIVGMGILVQALIWVAAITLLR